MKITHQPWAFVEPTHPGPKTTIGQLFDYGQRLLAVQHLRPGFLEKGTRVILRDGRKATVSNFVPYDGWNIGLSVDGLPNEGLITQRATIKVIK